MKEKDLKTLLEKIKEFDISIAEIKVTPKSAVIRGSKASILALMSCLTQHLHYHCDEHFSKEDIREAVEDGLRKMPIDDESGEVKADSELSKDIDKLNEMLDKLGNIADKLND